MKTFIPCSVCGHKAEWFYGPGKENYCNNCVPRGCSCNQELNEGIAYDSEEAKDSANYHEPLDEKLRRYPCCEYMPIAPESHDDKEQVAFGWEVYYENHPEQRRESDEIEHWEHKLGEDE